MVNSESGTDILDGDQYIGGSLFLCGKNFHSTTRMLPQTRKGAKFARALLVFLSDPGSLLAKLEVIADRLIEPKGLTNSLQ
jgi:hypothetical protein